MAGRKRKNTESVQKSTIKDSGPAPREVWPPCPTRKKKTVLQGGFFMPKDYWKDKNGRGLPAPAPPGQYEQTTLASLPKFVLLLKDMEDLESGLSTTGGRADTTRAYSLRLALYRGIKDWFCRKGGFPPQGKIPKKFRRAHRFPQNGQCRVAL